MGAELSGDFAGLQALAQKLAALPGKRRDLAEAVAEEALYLVQEGFGASTDPYGADWAPKADGSKCNLVATCDLRRGWHRKSLSADQTTIGPSVDYGKWHQSGTHHEGGGIKMVARKMVPDDGDIPPEWEQAIEEAAAEMLRELLS